jgi:hypothetical protein
MRRRTLLWPPFSLFSPLCAWPLSVRPQGHSACAASPSFSLCIWLSVESLPHWSLTVFLCCWPLPGNPGGGHAVQMLTLGPCGSLWLTVVDDSTLFFDNSPVTIRAAGYPATPRDGSCNETPPASSVRPSVLPPGGGMGQVGDLRASCSFLRSPFGATSPFFCGHRHPLHTAEGPCLRRFEPFFLLSLVNLPFPAANTTLRLHGVRKKTESTPHLDLPSTLPSNPVPRRFHDTVRTPGANPPPFVHRWCDFVEKKKKKKKT